MELQIDSSKMFLRLAQLQAATGKDAKTIVLEESRLFLKQVITTTPPYGLGGEAKKQGEEAVRRDIADKLITGIDPGFLDSVVSIAGSSQIDHWVTTKAGKKLHLKWDKIDASGSGMDAFHQGNRDRRGRAYRRKKAVEGQWRAAYVVSKEALAAYVAKVQARVGRRKAGWAVSYAALGGQLQQWIARHLGSVEGQCVDMTNSPNPYVTMTNSAPGLAQDKHIINSAMANRAESIRRKLKLILSGYKTGMQNGKIEAQL